MAVYNVKTALVKYNKETLQGDIWTEVKFRVANLNTSTTIYARVTIQSQGTLSWTFTDGTTSKDYTIGAGGTLDFAESIKPGSAPTETTKDSITFLVEYFKDSGYTQKFAEDTVNVEIHCYVQQSDGSWDSGTYSNVLYDYLTTPAVSSVTSMVFDNGLAKINVVSSRGSSASTVTGVINDLAIHWQSGDWGNRIYADIVYATDDTPIKDKFIAIVHKGTGGSGLWLTADDNAQVYKAPISDSAWKKAVVYSETYKARLSVQEHYNDLYFDGVAIFNPLP